MTIRPLLACCLVLVLAGCADMADWKNLTLGKPAAPKEAYKPLTSDVAEIAAPQQGGGPGIFCRVSKGSAKFGEKWLDFRPAEFALPEGARVTVALSPLRGEGGAEIQSWFSQKTQEMLFCPVVDGPPDKKVPCASLFALDEDLGMGIKRTFDIPGAVQGGVLSCARTQDKLKN